MLATSSTLYGEVMLMKHTHMQAALEAEENSASSAF